MDAEIAQCVAALHAAPFQVAMAVTGAASQSVAWLLALPGGSQTLLEAVTPYSRPALHEYLGFEPAQYASAAAALALAAQAYTRAERYQQRPGPIAGLGCAGALASVPARRGSHRAALACWDADGFTLYELELVKGRRDRAGEEMLVSRLVLDALAQAAGLHAPALCRLEADETLTVRRQELRAPVEALLRGELPALLLSPDGQLAQQAQGCMAVLPGSFNPLHYGHRELARVAAELTQGRVCFEIAARNVDKPTLDADSVLARLRQFAGYAAVAVTAAPLFVQKARLFGGATFVIGADTAARLVEPRYYGGSTVMDEAFAEMQAQGVRFLVAGRAVGERFLTLADLALPEQLRPLFSAIPAERFRADVSSTALRKH